MSGVAFNYNNNGFSLVDALEKGTNVNDNLKRIANSLDEHSELTAVAELKLFGLRLNAGKGFWSLVANY